MAANQAFYQAFSGLDIAQLEALCTCRADDLCVHPGWPPLRGWPAIRASWARIFANTERMDFFLSGEQARVEPGGELGHVELIENIRPDGAEQAQAIAARNSFRRVDGRWLLWAHVAAPLPD